jgi:hypothetical protein
MFRENCLLENTIVQYFFIKISKHFCWRRGCVRLGEPTTILAISMEMKSHEKSLGRNPLSDTPYRNLGMVLNGQGPGRHPLGGAPFLDLDTVLSKQESGCRILSDVLHHRPGVVKNEQGCSHLTRRMRMVRKLAEPSRVCVVIWNVGSLTGKLREVVDTMINQRVNILCVQETK